MDKNLNGIAVVTGAGCSPSIVLLEWLTLTWKFLQEVALAVTVPSRTQLPVLLAYCLPILMSAALRRQRARAKMSVDTQTIERLHSPWMSLEKTKWIP